MYNAGLTESHCLLSPTSTSYCVLPGKGWSSWAGRGSLTDQLAGGGLYSTSRQDREAGEALQAAMDSLPPPSLSLLSLLWLCDTPPAQPGPALAGALQRAVAWHAASLTVVTTTSTLECPDWLVDLRAELISLEHLCDCHGLLEFVPPRLVWQGGLAFYPSGALSPLTLPGFELHLGGTGNQAAGQLSRQREQRKHFSPVLEVVSTVPLSVALASSHLLSQQRVRLTTSLLTEDECTEKLMTEVFYGPDKALLLKLKVSPDLARAGPGLQDRNTEAWRQAVINCSALSLPAPPLGPNTSSLTILVFDDVTLESDCARNTRTKSGIVLRDLRELAGLITPRQETGYQQMSIDSIKEVVSNARILNVDFRENILLRQFTKKIQSKVLDILQKEDSELLKTNSVENISIAVQEKVLENIDITTHSSITADYFEDIENLMEERENVENIANSDDWQEKRFLRFLQLHHERYQASKDEQSLSSKILKPNEDDYVVMEAKELLKFFDSNGLSVKPLIPFECTVESKSMKPQKTWEEYEALLTENFEDVGSTDFSFKGLKLRDSNDFSKVEFTKYHDVYYNTGDKAESYDLECKRFRDCVVGPSRETKSSLSDTAARIKLSSKTVSDPADSKKQSNIKKNLNKSRLSPAKKTSAAIPMKKPLFANIGRQQLQLTLPKQQKLAGGLAGNSKPKAESKQAAGDELTEINRKKLRGAVYEALIRNGLGEKISGKQNPLFIACFRRLFNVCKQYVVGGTPE